MTSTRIDLGRWWDDHWGRIMFATFGVVVALLLLALALMLAGQYHYDYRCRQGVTERQWNWELGFGDLPAGGWSTIDGDPVTGCK